MNASQEFLRLFAAVQQLRASQTPEPAALATIVRTQGSTFRRAGASMLVHADGEVTCALAGGCPQRDIVLRAQRVMEERTPALVPYNRESNLDLLMEVGCGGELDVLIEPLVQSHDFRFLDVLALRADAAHHLVPVATDLDQRLVIDAGVAGREPERLDHRVQAGLRRQARHRGHGAGTCRSTYG